MKKAILGFTLGIGIALTGSAWAQNSIQDMQNQMMNSMANQMSASMQNQMMGSVQNQMAANPAPAAPAMNSGGSMADMGTNIANSMAGAMMSAINQDVSANINMGGLWKPNADQQAISSSPATLDIRQMIEQAIKNMPTQQRNQIADQMTQQNLAMLQQGAAAANKIRTDVRNTIMSDRYKSISAVAPNLYRSNIQPQMVQTIIGSIRPWELPNRFKSQMMPKVVEQVSGQIKMPQINFMQEGIGDATFPNVPGMPGVGDMSNAIKQQQMQYMQDGVMNSSFPMK